MDDIYTPVVKAKPERGREIKSAIVPTEALVDSQNVSGQPGQSTGQNEEIYHEGYVDGHKYLVPDSNLEAMKDIINIKMRPRRSQHYKHETSFEISDYDHFNKKLQELLDKMNRLVDTSSDSSKESSSVTVGTNRSSGSTTDSTEDAESKKSEYGTKENKATKENFKESKESSIVTIMSHSSKSMEGKSSGVTDTTERSRGTKTDSMGVAKSTLSEGGFKEIKASEESSGATLFSISSKAMREEQSIVSEDTDKFRGSKTDSSEDAESKKYEDESKDSKVLKEESEASTQPSLASLTSHSSKSVKEDISKSEDELQKEFLLSKDEKEAKKLERFPDVPVETKDFLKLPDLEKKALQWQEPLKEKKTKQIQQPSKLINGYKTIKFQEPLDLSGNKEEPLICLEPVQFDDEQKEPPTLKTPLKYPDPLKCCVDATESLKECRLRFIISGHLRDDKPLFIVHEHNSRSKIFKNRKADFIDSKRSGNMDLVISGKFYKNNILEELNGEPISYNILPKKIIIDQEKVRVYMDSFSDIFHCDRVALTITGKFLRQKISNLWTPLLSFSAEPKVEELSLLKEEYNPFNNDATTTVLMYTPHYLNPHADHGSNKNPENNDASDAVLNNNTSAHSCNKETSMVLIYTPIFTPKFINSFPDYDSKKILANNKGPGGVLGCESSITNKHSCDEKVFDSNGLIGPISVYLKDSTNSLPSFPKDNINEDNKHKFNSKFSSVDCPDFIGYEPNGRGFYTKTCPFILKMENFIKKWNRNRHQHFHSPYDSLDPRPTVLEEPKLNSYYSADEQNEYYSTHKDDMDNATQPWSSNNTTNKNEINRKKTHIEKKSKMNKRENPLGKETQKGKNTTIRSDGEYPGHGRNEEGSHLLLQRKSFYYADDEGEHYSNYNANIEDLGDKILTSNFT